MTTNETGAKSPSELIDERIASLADWRGATLATIRALIQEAEPDVGRHPRQSGQRDGRDQAGAEPDQEQQCRRVEQVREPGPSPAADVGQAPGRDAHARRGAEGPGDEVGHPVGAQLRVGIGGLERAMPAPEVFDDP